MSDLDLGMSLPKAWTTLHWDGVEIRNSTTIQRASLISATLSRHQMALK